MSERALRKVGMFGRRMDKKIRQEQLERMLREAAQRGDLDFIDVPAPVGHSETKETQG